jgi:large subunit ribosomal protein L33
MAKKKGDKRIKVILECTESVNGRRSRYYTTRNRINTPQKLEIRKYCKLLKRHAIFKEVK